MGWFVSDERVPVAGLGCLCEGSPHPDGDTVWLRAELDPDAGLAVLRLIREAQALGDNGAILEGLGRIYARFGVVDWTFLDDDGHKVPVTQSAIARLSWAAIAPIAEKGDALYAEALLGPLVARPSASSQNGRTARSTSANRPSSPKPRKPSRPSTTAITPLHPRRGTTSAGASSTSLRKNSA